MHVYVFNLYVCVYTLVRVYIHIDIDIRTMFRLVHALLSTEMKYNLC